MNPLLLLSVADYRVMGGTVNAMITNVSGSTKGKIPEQLLNSWLTICRPLFGALMAIIIVTFLISGLIQLGSLTTTLILAISFAVGISEHLLVKAIEGIL